MFKGLISYICNLMTTRSKHYITQKELHEYMRVEGVSYADVFPPDISYSANRNRKRR